MKNRNKWDPPCPLNPIAGFYKAGFEGEGFEGEGANLSDKTKGN